MKTLKIESLLLQEMENVKGGAGGTCQCSSGAGQSVLGDGKCICNSGAGQKAGPSIEPVDPVCICATVGAAQM